MAPNVEAVSSAPASEQVDVPEFRQILCPVDFSGLSREALEHAVVIAKWYGARVDVVYVHPLARPVLPPSAARADAARLDELTRASLDEALGELVADARLAGVAVDAVIEEDQDVPGAIVTRAAALDADVIALGTHGRSGFERLVLGSTAEKVIRRARCAVLTVPPPGHDAGLRPFASMERIVCAVEFSAESARALRFAASVARTSGARVTALHVLEIAPDPLDGPPQAFHDSRAVLFQHARAAMGRLVTAAMRTVCGIDELLLVGKAYREILRVASEQQADLIVMGRHGRGVIDALFFGSTTQHVIRNAVCPVLTVRATDPPDVVAVAGL